jgi:hypothetical protein
LTSKSTLQARAVKEGQGLASWRIICNKYSQRTREPDDFKNLSEQLKREDVLGEVLPEPADFSSSISEMKG